MLQALQTIEQTVRFEYRLRALARKQFANISDLIIFFVAYLMPLKIGVRLTNTKFLISSGK